MKYPKHLSISIIAAILIFLMAMPGYIRRTEPEIVREEFRMGSLVTIKAPAEPNGGRSNTVRAINKAFDEMMRIESLFSLYRPDSEISRINRLGKGEPLAVSKEVFDLIQRSIELNKKTEGAFDITVKPLADLWAQAKIVRSEPTADKVDEAISRVGSKYIHLDSAANTIAFERDGMSIDMNAIVQGYACDRAIEILKDNGIRDAVVDTSGEVYCLGRRYKDSDWVVGVRHPRDKTKVLMEIRLRDMAISTSGDYEKFFKVRGKRYSHLVDPRTGRAVGDSVLSASVIAKDAATADALSTALSISGAEGMRFLDTASGEDAVLVIREDRKHKVLMSEGLDKRYVVKKTSRP